MSSCLGLRVVIGVSAGIAAYKAPALVREFVKAGAEVRVILTHSAQQFVSPLALQAVSGHEVYTQWFDSHTEHGMGHIDLARWADVVVIAPATAHCIANLVHGFGGDLLTATVLATQAPLFVCPAMNRQMWDKPAVQRNVTQLRGDGVHIVGPDRGEQACGDVGFGRMTEPDEIMKAVSGSLISDRWLEGRRVVVTAGPTQEPLDPVRFLGNRSSGKMGYAIATRCAQLGAHVDLVSGPVAISVPDGVSVHSIMTAKEMLGVTRQLCSSADLFFSVAAVADFTPVKISEQKIKKDPSESVPTIALEKNPDIVATIKSENPDLFVIGFAAESENVEQYARKKLETKNLNMIVANNIVEDGVGFGADANRVLVMDREGQVELGPTLKSTLAQMLLDLVKSRMP